MRILIHLFVVIHLSLWSSFLHAAQIIEDTEKKITYYIFGDDIEWQLQGAEGGEGISSWFGASKSGSINNYKHIYHYHLNINQNRLRVRLSVQDENSEHQSNLEPDNLVVMDVTMDGKRLSLFKWCLENQQPASKVLGHSAVVKNTACSNSKDIGEFIMRLDNKTKRAFIKSKNIEIAFLINDERINLVYSMNGFSKVMYQVDSSLIPIPVIKKIAKKKKFKEKKAVRTLQISKPKTKIKSHRICYITPALEFKATISAIPYPCDDIIKKATAEGFMSARTLQEKQQRKTTLDAKKFAKARSLALAKAKQEKQAKKSAEMKVALGKEENKTVKERKREHEWDVGQSVMWISRCKKRWEKGFSPCYCKKYINQAPIGVKDACEN